eukprot:402533_1
MFKTKLHVACKLLGRTNYTYSQSLLYTSKLTQKDEFKLSLKDEYGLFINGKFESSSDGSTFEIENPANGNILCKCANAQPNDVNKAINYAYESYMDGRWKNMDIRQRSYILNKAANLLKEYVFDIAYMESLQTGRPIREMNAQLQRLPHWLEYFSSLIRTFEGTVPPFEGNYINYVQRVPLGVIAQITPWNHPMLIAIKKIAPALATGNSIVCKPSEFAPCSVLEFAQILTQAGVPDGVFNVITGIGHDSGQVLCKSNLIKKIDITGGTETGKIIGQMAGNNLAYYTAELGGKAPVIVCEDIVNNDMLTQCINGITFGSFIASGQTCIMGARILIQESIYDIVVEKLVEKVQKIKCGLPQNISTQFGPLINNIQRNKVIEFVEYCHKTNEGKILCGGKIPNDNNELNNGYYYEPTIIGNCNVNMRIVKEEIFGPVIVLIKFKNDNDAINIANNSKYGLAASIWTNSISRAHRIANNLDVGIIWINDHHRNDPSSPWGGTKQSGLGRENGIDAFREYTQTKSVIINCNDKPFDWFVDDSNVRYS